MIRFLLSAVLFCTLLLPASAQEAVPESPSRFVTDNAGFLSEPVRQALDQRLGSYASDTGHQILVWIGRTTGRIPIEDWAVRAFGQWRIGRKGIDDGLAIFIFADDRKLRIEVGYGLEATVTDALASRIINEIMVPRIQTGDRDGAVTAGVDAVVSIIGGQAERVLAPVRRGRSRPASWLDYILPSIIGLVFLVLLITNPQLAIYLLMNMLASGRTSGRRGGSWGGGGGGGGFSGGGGRSGGGGASGSW